MNSALVVGLYPTEACPIFTLNFAKALSNLGVNTHVVIPSSMDNIQDWLELRGKVSVHTINLYNYHRIPSRIGKAIALAKFSITDGRKIAEENGGEFDLTFYTFFHSLNTVVGNAVASNRHVLFLHDPKMHSGETERRRKQLSSQAKQMDDLIVLSRSFIPYTEHTFKIEQDHVHYMPHCLYRPIVSREKCLSRIHDAEGINFLFFGRIEKYKGIDTLLRAYGILEAKYPNSRLTIAGAGDFSPYEGEFSKLSSCKLINRYIGEGEIDKFFSMDNCVLVVPYDDATQSGVIALALSYGVPVISSNLDGLKEQLDDGQIGAFFNPGDVDELFEKMYLYVNNRGLLTSSSLEMLQYARSLDWNNATSRLIEEL